jgi:hypothetical protein
VVSLKQRLDQFVTFSHFSTEMGDLAYSFYCMLIQLLYVLLRYVVGQSNRQHKKNSLDILNGLLVPLSIGMILS